MLQLLSRRQQQQRSGGRSSGGRISGGSGRSSGGRRGAAAVCRRGAAAAEAAAAAAATAAAAGAVAQSLILTRLPHTNVQPSKILRHHHSRRPSGHNLGNFISKILGGNFLSCEERRRSNFSRSSRRSFQSFVLLFLRIFRTAGRSKFSILKTTVSYRIHFFFFERLDDVRSFSNKTVPYGLRMKNQVTC